MYATPIVFVAVFLSSRFLDDEKELNFKQHILRALKITGFAFIAVWIIASVFSDEGYGGMHRYG
tara:strand:- start:86 stop:277 length:192 start_codon:yes stop_codon:yes gene_type:complete